MKIRVDLTELWILKFILFLRNSYGRSLISDYLIQKGKKDKVQKVLVQENYQKKQVLRAHKTTKIIVQKCAEKWIWLARSSLPN